MSEPKTTTALCQFEAINGSLANIAAVLAAAGEEVDTDGMSQRGVLMLYAAEEVLERAMWKMSGAIATAYAEGRA